MILPDGTEKTILSVPNYDFNWQTYYMFKEPLQVPKGAKIVSYGVVRQLREEQVQSGPEDGREVGRPDLGRDAVHGGSLYSVTSAYADRQVRGKGQREKGKGRRQRREGRRLKVEG